MIMKPGPQLKLPLWFSLSARQHQFFCCEDFTGKEFNQLHTKKTMLYHPIVATERFKSSYVNRLVFSYDINSLM